MTSSAPMRSVGEWKGQNWYWADGRFENPGPYYWNGSENVHAGDMITSLADENDRLRRELARERSLLKVQRDIDVPAETRELLVQCAFEVGEISHSRAAELLGVSVDDIRARGWVQGDGLDALHATQQATDRLLSESEKPKGDSRA